jgi:hypothetical protein
MRLWRAGADATGIEEQPARAVFASMTVSQETAGTKDTSDVCVLRKAIGTAPKVDTSMPRLTGHDAYALLPSLLAPT